MILSHECEIQKEFNERVHELLADGIPEDDAERQAARDQTLDRYVVVAPLLALGEIGERRRPSIRNGQRIGYFYVPPIPTVGTVTGESHEYAVHLSRVATIDRAFFDAGYRVASLSAKAVGVLRYKLTQVFATRDLALLAELQKAIGRTIANVQTHQVSKERMSIALYLDDGSILHLEGKPIKPTASSQVKRNFPPS